MCTKDQSLSSGSSNPPSGSPKSSLFTVEVGTPAWKERAEVTGVDQYHELVDIHKALLPIHSRINTVEYSVQQLVHSSFRVRQSTPIVSVGSESSNSQLADESELDSCSLTPKTTNSLAPCSSKLIDAPGSSDHEEPQLQATVEDMCLKLGLSPNLTKVLHKESHSRKNLVSKLVRQVFSVAERESSNVMGLKGKKRLDPSRIELVRSLTFLLQPVRPGESEVDLWRKECVKAIDSTNRNINQQH